jgi:hypothetical protein
VGAQPSSRFDGIHEKVLAALMFAQKVTQPAEQAAA